MKRLHNPAGILADKGTPGTFLVLFARRNRQGVFVEVMANGDSQCIGSIKKLRVEVFLKQLTHHLRHLVFGGITIARNGLLDTAGSVLNDGDISRQGSGHHNALRPAQFKHRLHVLAEKWVFNGHLVRVVFVNQPQNGFVEFLKLELVGAIFAQLNHAVLNHTHHAPRYGDDAVSGNHGAGVYTQNNFLFGSINGLGRNNHGYGVGSFTK